MQTPAAIAIAAHPDDIEFYMAGTLLRLKEAGWHIHCFNLSSGNLGSKTIPGHRIAPRRRQEARAAARLLGASWHPPFARDLEIFYNDESLRRVSAVIRQTRPSILLTHAPQDYMEDHVTTARLAVTAAFARGFPNYRTKPRRAPIDQSIAVYHAMPHMLRDPLGQRVQPEAFVDISPAMPLKRQALAAHRSQKEWLDATQGIDSYLTTMESLSRELGRWSGTFKFAEGWRRHLYVGFGEAGSNPLQKALRTAYLVNKHYPA